MLGILVKYGNAQDNDINELLKRNNIGYRCEYVIGDVTWYQEEENVVINKIKDLQYKVKTISQQTFEELEQAKKLLDNVNNERAIKDAVRSALSAIESLIKNIVKDEKINDDYDKAMTKLVAKGIGRKEILYNDNLWKTLHKLYPDLRHGSKNEVISKMPIEEAKYWIGKITNLSEYIISIAQL